MLQNLKVDVIYYLCPSDFEMEFNLCGCCRMRLLSDKVEDKKGFVNSLSRAATRSQVIIACGQLAGDDGLLNLTAKAIGSAVVEMDAKEFGVLGNEPIKIIDKATPLVSPQGIFGGCIIVSGNQTIILLSENSSVKKTIMQTLIHPYITDLSMTAVASKGAHDADVLPEAEQTAEEQPQEEIQEAEETAENAVAETEQESETVVQILRNEPATEASPEKEPENSAEPNDVFSSTKEEEPQKDAESDIKFESEKEETEEKEEKPVLTLNNSNPVDLYINPERADKRKMFEYARNYTPSESDALFIAEDMERMPFDNGIPERGGFPYNTVIAILVAVLIVIAAALCVIIFLLPYLKGMSITEYASQIFSSANLARKFLI